MTDNQSPSKDRFVNTVKESLQEEMSTATSSVDKGERFLIWAITRIVDASKDEVREQITDGKDDMGIDSWIKPAVASESGGPIQLFIPDPRFRMHSHLFMPFSFMPLGHSGHFMLSLHVLHLGSNP